MHLENTTSDEYGPLYFDDPRAIIHFPDNEDKENMEENVEEHLDFRGERDISVIPQTPIKSKVKNNITRYSPAIVAALNNRFNMELEKEIILPQTHDNLSISSPNYVHGNICTRKIKHEGIVCGREAFRHKMCPYHWGLWKRENPFSNKPW
jgi:hypothetical protein